ncbi:Hypothetical_protein [Hexamita inflata]|uniref:Hypothetical_protein n=1 Tax=Hexamita inflata TaxID=28002 RepID=A0AA86N8N7_9EUKA|nr:Hypothetical protein HINF_LOCUS2632 [Hexamita inflata]
MSLNFIRGEVPSVPFNLVVDSLTDVKKYASFIPHANQLLVNNGLPLNFVSNVFKQPLSQLKNLHTFTNLDQGLSQLNNDDLTLILTDSTIQQQLKNIQLIQRFGSNLKLVQQSGTQFVIPKGQTDLKITNGNILLFPLHGKTEVKINGVDNLLDVGGEICEFVAENVKVETDMPTLVTVE